MALLRFCGVGGSKQSQGSSGSPGTPTSLHVHPPRPVALPGGQLDLGAPEALLGGRAQDTCAQLAGEV